MAIAAVRLREQLPSIEANDIDIHIEREECEVFEVKKQMIWLMTKKDDRQSRINQGSCVGTKLHRQVDLVNEEIMLGRTERLKGEMERLKTRLDNQKDLIDDLLLTNDHELIKRELQTLDKVYD